MDCIEIEGSAIDDASAQALAQPGVACDASRRRQRS
jgi:hypothetical protein